MSNSDNIESARRSASQREAENDSGKENGQGNSTSEASRDLEQINEAHISRVDKFFRMYAGTASNLTGFHAGYIYLEIRVDDSLRISLEKITRNIAMSWRNEKELSGAVGYCALLYKSARWSGFVLEANATAGDAAAALKRMKEPANARDVFIKMIEEVYALPEPAQAI